MPRKLAWVVVLLVVAALAVPATAAPRAAGTGSIFGKIIDSTTGLPVDLTGGGVISVDVFNLAGMARSVVWVSGTQSATYNFGSLVPGQYKMRFRYWDAGENLISYRWYPRASTFDAASSITVIAGAALRANVTLRPMPGAGVSGTVVEKGTGIPLTGCYEVDLYEAAGISLGWINTTAADGTWAYPDLPAGRYTALVFAVSDPAVPGCEGPPAHLDTWFKGASGFPLRSGFVAHAATFATARTFRVVAGVDVTAITIQMPPAPTCRGRAPTIYGTTLADVISGTPGRDIISGLAGDDRIYGLSGNDLICGDAGNDLIRGGAGTDTAVGGPGTDDCLAERTFTCSP